jgi:hypothetical protein
MMLLDGLRRLLAHFLPWVLVSMIRWRLHWRSAFDRCDKVSSPINARTMGARTVALAEEILVVLGGDVLR